MVPRDHGLGVVDRDVRDLGAPGEAVASDPLLLIVLDRRFELHPPVRREAEERLLPAVGELGVDLGAKLFSKACANKKILIVAQEPFLHQIGLSDLSNSDIRVHKSDAETLAKEVRNWFRESGVKSVPPGSVVWADFNAFMSDFQIKREKEGYKDADIRKMPVPEFLDFIYRWVEENCG